MNSALLDQDISYLNLNSKIINILKDNDILSVYDLWIQNRKNLKKINLNDQEIKEIIIKLELHGIDLNKKTNK